jgi:glycosyltransferase involved in cell wall biosynthesis
MSNRHRRSPMKIALIDPSLFTWPYDHALVDGLSGSGHSVTLFTKHLSPQEPGKNAPEIVEFFYPGLQTDWAQKLPHAMFLALKGLMHPICLLNLLRHLRRIRPDVIHFQWAPLPVIDRFFLPAIRNIAPAILTVHDSAPFNDNPRSILQRIGAIGIMSSFDRLIVHTNRARQRLIDYGLPAGKIAIIAHGVMKSDFVPLAPLTKPSASKPVTVLLFGKIKPYKGADVLIRALAAMPAASRARCRVHVVGKPYMDMEPLFALARELGVESNIVWDLRFVAEDELNRIFAEADIIVMPYREIDASGVLMLGLSTGLPIVASRIGLFAEVLDDGKHGRLVTPDQPDELAEALTALVDSSAERTRMSANVQALQDSIPDWQTIGAQTAALYDVALGEFNGARRRAS